MVALIIMVPIHSTRAWSLVGVPFRIDLTPFAFVSLELVAIVLAFEFGDLQLVAGRTL